MTKDIPIYKITIDPEYSDGEELGIEQIAFTSTPAIITKGMSFEELTRILGSTKASVPTQNLTINDVIAGIQSQYGQTPQGSMG